MHILGGVVMIKKNPRNKHTLKKTLIEIEIKLKFCPAPTSLTPTSDSSSLDFYLQDGSSYFHTYDGPFGRAQAPEFLLP